jgi:hypothetical protein
MLKPPPADFISVKRITGISPLKVQNGSALAPLEGLMLSSIIIIQGTMALPDHSYLPISTWKLLRTRNLCCQNTGISTNEKFFRDGKIYQDSNYWTKVGSPASCRHLGIKNVG